jgi:hypothetical protein
MCIVEMNEGQRPQSADPLMDATRSALLRHRLQARSYSIRAQCQPPSRSCTAFIRPAKADRTDVKLCPKVFIGEVVPENLTTQENSWPGTYPPTARKGKPRITPYHAMISVRLGDRDLAQGCFSDLKRSGAAMALPIDGRTVRMQRGYSWLLRLYPEVASVQPPLPSPAVQEQGWGHTEGGV